MVYRPALASAFERHPLPHRKRQPPSDPFAVDEARVLDALQMRWDGLCDVTVRDGTWHAERNGHEVSGDTPDALTQAILITWGGR